jgi:hypothetical protein
MNTDNECPFISTPQNSPHHSGCPLIDPSTVSSQYAWYVHYHLSSTASMIGGTTYGQNITTATTGKYLFIPTCQLLLHFSLSSPTIPPSSLPETSPPAEHTPEERKELTSSYYPQSSSTAHPKPPVPAHHPRSQL